MNDIVNVELGHRHHDILQRFEGEVSKLLKHQGFWTSKQRYVNRSEAARIAWESGQIVDPVNRLYSEDIY